MAGNDSRNTSGVRLGQVRQGPVRSPEWRQGEAVSARKLNQMSAVGNRTYVGPNPGRQMVPTGASDGGGSSSPVDATIVGQIRFFSE